MKKILSFLCVIGVVAIMTSCLRANHSYQDTGIVFIATSTEVTPNVRYGRALARQAGYLITNSRIQTELSPGSFYRFSFAWEEADGRTRLSERIHADNVTIVGNITEIPSTRLIMSPAPTGATTPRFITVGPLWMRHDLWWEDYWVFEFAYRGGTTPPRVEFFRRGLIDGDNNINIDIRITGDVTQGETIGTAFVALGMSRLRELYQQVNARVLNIRFHFYQEGQETPQMLPPISWQLAGTEL